MGFSGGGGGNTTTQHKMATGWASAGRRPAICVTGWPPTGFTPAAAAAGRRRRREASRRRAARQSAAGWPPGGHLCHRLAGRGPVDGRLGAGSRPQAYALSGFEATFAFLLFPFAFFALTGSMDHRCSFFRYLFVKDFHRVNL